GARMLRRADEHGDRAGEGAGADGAGDEARRGGRARGVPRGPYAAQALFRRAELPDVRIDRLTPMRERGGNRAPRGSARAVLALVAATLAVPICAAPLVPDEIAKLCVDAEGTSQCGRRIEQVQLKRLPNLATRDGATLKVSLYPAGSATFTDVDTLHGG